MFVPLLYKTSKNVRLYNSVIKNIFRQIDLFDCLNIRRQDTFFLYMIVSLNTIKLFLKGEGAAFKEIYESYKRITFFVILSYLNNENDVEDIYHDVWLKVIDNKESIKDPKLFDAYFLNTAKHIAINFNKKNCKTVIDSNEFENNLSFIDNSPIDDLLPYKISVEEKQIISLRVVFELPWKDICQIMDMPISTAKLKYKEALKMIKKEIER